MRNFSQCSDKTLQMTTVNGFNCYVNNISCRFLNLLNDTVASKHFYQNFDDALDDVKHGKLSGLIQFATNFTSSFRPLHELQDLMENQTDNGDIQIFLDQSDRQIVFFLKQKLFGVFEEFVESLMKDCGKSRRVGSLPIRVETVFGSLNDEMQRSMAPGIIITLCFFISSMMTATAFVSDRLDGIWNRIVLAGVEPVEVLISHIVFNSFMVVVQTAGFFIIMTFVFKFKNDGSSWLVLALVLLVGLSAITYGIAVSILAKDYVTATFASTLVFYPMMLMCGIFWPLEAIPWYLRYLAQCLPFTLPTVALKDILYKGYSLVNFSVQIGFLVILSWIILSLIVCVVALKSKKYFNT